MRPTTRPTLAARLVALSAALLVGGCGGGEDRLPSDGDDPIVNGSIPLFLSGDAQAVGASPRIATLSCEAPFQCPLDRFEVRLDATRTSDPAIASAYVIDPDPTKGVRVYVHGEGEATITIEYSYTNSGGERRYGTIDKKVRASAVRGVDLQDLYCERGPRGVEPSVSLNAETRQIALFDTDSLHAKLTVDEHSNDYLNLEGMTLDALMRLDGDPVFASSLMGIGGFRFILDSEAQASAHVQLGAGTWSLAVHNVTPAQVDGALILPSRDQLRLRVGDVPVCLPTQPGDEAVRFESQTPNVCQWSRADGWRFSQVGTCETTATYIHGRGGQGASTTGSFRVTEDMITR